MTKFKGSTFQVGDVVEITKESASTGLLDFIEGKGYKVERLSYYEHNSTGRPYRKDESMRLANESGVTGWYSASHFKLKGEETMEDTVKFKIGDTLVCTETNPVELSANSITTGEEYVVTGLWELGVCIVNDDGEELGVCDYRFKLKENTMESNENHFKVGQTVWDVVYGKGEVVNVLQNVINYPIVVKFVDGKRHFTEDGKLDENYARTLFFSEPKIIAETKPPFVPTFKKGDVLFTYGKHKEVTGDMGRIVVSIETEQVVFDENDLGWLKTHWEFYKLGEKIEFN